MEFTTVLFYIFALLLTVSGLKVITSRNPVASALFLVLAFFNAAAIWMLLQAEFLAILLVLVYVGAVMVLFLFVVMMLDINLDVLRRDFKRFVPMATIVGAIIVIETALILWHGYGADRRHCGLVEHASDRQGDLYRLHLRVRSGRPRAAGRDHRGDRADHAPSEGQQTPAHFRPGGGAQQGPRAHREDEAGNRAGPGNHGTGNGGSGRSNGRWLGPCGQSLSAPEEKNMLTLAHYLVLGAILFAISIVGIFLNRRNVIIILMAIELMLLAVNTNFVAFSHYLGDVHGQIFVFFVLTVAAAEAAIGLAILVTLFRSLDTINVEDLDQLKG
jgi:NADH:ubiquinone oxidoreductase subunit K/NADH:ubiquinone oxidoreductase subunit 6 (subunit J)